MRSRQRCILGVLNRKSVLKSGLHMKVGRRRKLKVKLGEMAKKTKKRETGIFGDQERDWLTIF